MSDTGRSYHEGMSAQPAHGSPDPEDPAEILRVLPEAWHPQFYEEYSAALDAAHEVQQWAALRELLHLWRLRADAYSTPGFEESLREARDAQPGDLTPVPGWTVPR